MSDDCSGAHLRLELPRHALSQGAERELWAGQHSKLGAAPQRGRGAREDDGPLARLHHGRQHLAQRMGQQRK